MQIKEPIPPLTRGWLGQCIYRGEMGIEGADHSPEASNGWEIWI